MKTLLSVAISLVLLGIVPACAKKETAATSTADVPHKHEHKPPHGGTPVVLGEEAYHLELVRDAATGKLTLYVLDGEMENFVRVAAAKIEVTTKIADKSDTLVFAPVENSATGEKLGDTSQFEVTASWLKMTATFDGVVAKIDVRGTSFSSVAFNFPKGNDKD